MKKEYYVGLDMGTSSVGWAVTDTDYNLMRAKGKDMWGVRLFSEAETAAKRRIYRTSRRRRMREKARIGFIKEVFAEEINKIDPGFYQRLEDSMFFEEDKSEHQPFALFADSGYTDVEYYKDYPTIFHLRKELIHSDEKHDVRLVFLAILNIFKHRGHFLNTNIDEEGVSDITELCTAFLNELAENIHIDFSIERFAEVLEDILPSKDYSNSRKVEMICNNLDIIKSKNKELVECIKLMCGLTGKPANIFSYKEWNDDNKKFAVSFNDVKYEEKIIILNELLSDEEMDTFLTIKQIFDWGLLSNIMKGYVYLSDARVDLYNKHNSDLHILKDLIKANAPKEYNSLFRVMTKDNYSAYVGSVNSAKVKERRGAKCDENVFFKKIEKLVNPMPDSDKKEYVLEEISKRTFLPKQLTSANGVIPNQVHKKELIAIINNAKKYLGFLNIKDENGILLSDKIISMFEFHIPYYIGPLSNDQNGTGWAVRLEKGKIFPWNFEQKIDVKKSAELFIEKMVRKCTYLNNENVLPKNSLLYEKFMVLNELNNLRINGRRLGNDDLELKQAIYNDIFKCGKKVRKNTIIKYLQNNGYVEKDVPVEISGIDGDFTNTLSNYAKFTSLLGVDTLTYEQERMAEDIIFWSTVYGDSKRFLKEKISEKYGDVLDEFQVKKIMSYKFRDWGRLSGEFLKTEGVDKDTGEIDTIISRMWNENYNLMELLSGKFTYIDVINEKSLNIEKSFSEFEYEDLDELYLSAPVKRMVWQTMLILKEIYKILGYGPKRVFIEMARDNEKKGERKNSRKNNLLALYKNCKDEYVDWVEEIDKEDESRFRIKKLYLYYLQKGRCMYSGKPIDLHDLMNNNIYDIDHIYPRHFTKDDSLENNLVLVDKRYNADKLDIFPIDPDIQRKQHSMWKMLREGNFITEEKYKRLTRKDGFSDDEKVAFINRQLVETRQGTKAIAELLERTFETEIVYVKAGLVSQFRNRGKEDTHDSSFVKCRTVNNLHHANDAYLNIVVGNTYYVKFTKDPRNFIKEYNKNKVDYHMYKIFDYTVERNGEIAWDTTKNKSIGIVRKVMQKNTPLITRMNYEAKGQLFDQTIYSSDIVEKVKGEGYIPVKCNHEILSNTQKYGGKRKYTGTYFFLVEHIEKGRKIRTLEAMPLYMKDSLDSKEKLEEYCEKVLNYNLPVVRLERIKMYSLLKINGFLLYLTGRSKDQLLVSNAVELKLNMDEMRYIKKVSEVDINSSEERFSILKITKEKNIEIYDMFTKKHCKGIFSKRPNPVGDKLDNKREKFVELSIQKQVFVLQQILQLSLNTNDGANLLDIGESKSTGVMTLNKKISNYEEVILLNRSVTGMYENEINLLIV